MMTNLFLPVLKMSAVGSIVILAVMLVRLLLRGAPKIYSYLLWSVAAFRLLCPVAVASRISFFNYVEDAPAVPVSDAVTAVITEPKSNSFDILSVVWLGGIVILVIYSIVTYYRLKIKLKGAEYLYDNVYCAQGLPSPFVMGFLSPVIYIPAGLSNEAREYVLKHERVHIRRRDHMIKLFAFGILSLHWFNPLCWIAFILMSRDMEMSCDERVLRDGNSIKTYGNALISMATASRFPSPGPISFGEVGVRRRVRNILGWKKPAIWITVISVIICIGTVTVFATDAEIKKTEPQISEEAVLLPETAEFSDTYELPDSGETTTADTTAADTTTADTTTADTTTADTTTTDTTTADTTTTDTTTADKPAVSTHRDTAPPATQQSDQTSSDTAWTFDPIGYYEPESEEYEYVYIEESKESEPLNTDAILDKTVQKREE